VSASGQYSTVIGNSSTASGDYSVSIGQGCNAGGSGSVCIGDNQVTTGNHGIAIGYNNTAGGDALAIGEGNNATGSASFAFGNTNTASQFVSVCFGTNCTGTATGAVGIGNCSQASGAYAICVGSSPQANRANASGAGSTALGYAAQARIVNTTNISGPIINRKDAGEGGGAGAFFQNFAGAEVVLFSDLVNFKALATHTITLPTGCHFYPNECGIVANSVAAATVQPTVSFGITGTNAALQAAALTNGQGTLTSNYSRYRQQTLLTWNGQTSLTGTVTVVATATTLQGRYYFKGILLEDN
jgi:hypothetical protein